MLIGNFSRVGSDKEDEQSYTINLGDYFQIMAIDKLLTNMGIREENIRRINMCEIENYSGEKMVLPINYLLRGEDFCKEGRFLFPENIIPVFLGVSFLRIPYNDYNVSYLKKHSPIGCRDRLTYASMIEHNIPAYLSGCLTITFPDRLEDEGNSIYFVDVPKSLENYIPYKFRNHIQYRHHIITYSKKEKNDERKDAEQQLLEYCKNAKLVVTSRLHCALPCLAIGIPTILVREYSSYTFDWVEELTPVFYRNNFSKINWEVSKKNLDYWKKKARNIAKEHLNSVINETSFSNRNHNIYDTALKTQQLLQNDYENMGEKIKQRFPDYDKNLNYMLWGINQVSDFIYDFMCENYKKSRLIGVIDTYKDIEFKGIKSIKPNEIENENGVVFVISGTLAANAQNILDSVGKSDVECFYLFDSYM